MSTFCVVNFPNDMLMFLSIPFSQPVQSTHDLYNLMEMSKWSSATPTVARVAM